MVTATTMANNGIGFGDIQSTFPSSRYGAVSEPYKLIKAEMVKGQVVLPTMWWDIQGVAWTECVWSCGVEIFHLWRRPKWASPYIHPPCQGTLYELSTWYSTLVPLSRSHLITFPHLPSHAGLSSFDPYLCSIVFLDLLSDHLYINSCHCHR